MKILNMRTPTAIIKELLMSPQLIYSIFLLDSVCTQISLEKIGKLVTVTVWENTLVVFIQDHIARL